MADPPAQRLLSPPFREIRSWKLIALQWLRNKWEIINEPEIEPSWISWDRGHNRCCHCCAAKTIFLKSCSVATGRKRQWLRSNRKSLRRVGRHTCHQRRRHNDDAGRLTYSA